MALSITGTLRAIRQGKTWCKMAAGYFNRHQRSTLYGVEEEIICQPLELDRAIGCTQEKQRQRLQLPPDQPVNPRVLKVAIIGAYNSGKSTLTNSLMGWKVSAASCKIHTTQKNVLAVHTEGDTQIIFRDTPGLIRGSKISEKKRNKLLKSVLEDPKKSLVQADLICVMIDASDSWDIEFLDENIYHLLWKNKHIPSVLILNKIDLLKRRDFLLHITRMLTMDTVGGNKIPITTSKTKPGWKVMDIIEAMQTGGKKSKAVKTKLDSLFDRVDKARRTKQENTFQDGKTQDCQDGHLDKHQDFNGESHDESSISYQQYTDIGRPDIPEYALKKPIPKGWDSFERVFMISALHGKGVPELKDYMMSCASPGDWCYHSSVVTDQNPYELAEKIVWEKMLEHLHKEIPYKYYPVVTFWSMQNDVLTIHVNINMFRSRSMSIVIGPKGSLIQKIKEESHAALMDAFRCDVILSLRVYKEEKKKGSKNKEYLDMKAFEKDKKSAQNTSKKPEVFTANNT